MKRILVAGMHHESNSFNPIITGEKDFKVIYGQDIYDNLRENDSVTGIIKTLDEKGFRIIPAVFARAVPNGEVDHDFYIKIKNEILEMALSANKISPLDGIVLSLHGSMRVKEIGDAEGFLLEGLRSLFPQIPIFSSLDMHTTMTNRMYDNCSGFVGYKCAPHTDCYETGAHAAKMMIDFLDGKINPKTAWVKVPFLVAGEKSSTLVSPMKELIECLRETEGKEGIFAASYLMGFPWADNEDCAVGVYVVSDKDLNLAQKEALRLARLIWSKRHDFCFHTETYEETEALDVAFKAVSEGCLPVYLSDSGDNPTAGASSDQTGFLKLILEDIRTDKLETPVIYGGIYDPKAVSECENKTGDELSITIGGKFDKSSSSLTITGTVKSFIKGWSREGMIKSDLVLFRSRGVDIVIAGEHVGYITPEMFTDLGRNPQDAQIVVCKLGYLTHQHNLIAGRSIMALTKGNTHEDLESIKYVKLKRPIFPLDKDFVYEPEKNLL